MSNGIQFDFDNEPRVVVQTKVPAMVNLVIKLSGGLIKDSTQANYVLIGFAIIAFTISFFLFSGGRVITQHSKMTPVGMPPIIPTL